MKRIIAILLACMTVMGLFTACGSPEEPAETKMTVPTETVADVTEMDQEKLTMKVWCPAEELEATREMVAAFAEEHPEYDCSGITCVELEADKVVTGLREDSDLAADVFPLSAGSLTALVEEGLLMPIFIDAEHIRSLYGEGAIEAVQRHHEELDMDLMYGVPFTMDTWFLYYNNALYTAEEVRSLETMLEKDLGKDMKNFSCRIGSGRDPEAFFLAAGCNAGDRSGENGLAAGNYLCALAVHPLYQEEDGSGIAVQMMKDGTLAALCADQSVYEELYAALGEKLSACALPAIRLGETDCQLGSYADYRVYSVKSGTAHPLAAQQLAAWLCSEESQLIRYRLADTTPAAVGLMGNEEVAADCSNVGVLAQSLHAHPRSGDADAARKATEALGKGILDGTVTPENLQEALDQA